MAQKLKVENEMNDNFSFDDELDTNIDLTPLIDVVFLLIIFFVIATTFSKPVLDIVLPAAKSAEETKGTKEELVVEIDKRGRVFCEEKFYKKNEMQDLVQLKPSLKMNLHVDREAPFESFIAIIDSAKVINRKNIVVTTKNEKL